MAGRYRYGRRLVRTAERARFLGRMLEAAVEAHPAVRLDTLRRIRWRLWDALYDSEEGVLLGGLTCRRDGSTTIDLVMDRDRSLYAAHELAHAILWPAEDPHHDGHGHVHDALTDAIQDAYRARRCKRFMGFQCGS